jgi:hypothetical protein
MNELETRLDTAMRDLFQRITSETGYTPTSYLELAAKHGNLETARMLFNANAVSEDFLALRERGRLDLTVEGMLFDEPGFDPLFGANIQDMIWDRMRQYEYEPTMDPLNDFVGAIESNVPDWAENHDKYIGLALYRELQGNGPDQGS